MFRLKKVPFRYSVPIIIALILFALIFANKVVRVSAALSCGSPTTITGGGTFSITTSGTCFKYVNTSFVNGGLFSVMKDATATSDTLQWYGGTDQNATSCSNQSVTISGNGGQLNNFAVPKDSTGAMYLQITGTGANSVTISIQNWQNGSGCSVKPTAVGTTGATTAPTNTVAPTKATTATKTNTPITTTGPTATTAPTKTKTPIPTTGPTATKSNTAAPTTTTVPTKTKTATFVPPTATSGPVGTFVPLLAQTPLNVSNGNPVTGNATWFSALGSPYGGCGVTQSALDTQNFLAINVQNTPGDYSTFLPRPISSANASKIGMFDNGYNCGRWVKVTISDYCTGTNDGAAGQPFCRNGSWVPDQFNGATLDMIVADSCQDSNAWCRDDPYHVDLAQAAVEGQFMLNGQPVTTMYPNSWNNRHVTWQFESAPNYTGDIKIGMIQSAQLTWTPIAITHLQNGIHGVDYFRNGAWVSAQMDSDMGETYIVLPTASGASTYQIRVYDSNNTLINNGRIYNFTFPSACGSSCSGAYTPVSYTTQ